MLIPLHEIRIIFEKISKKALNGGTSVVILCSYDVDSLCAVQIFTGLLKSESISYKVIPISGYPELEKQLDKLKENQELKSLVFINNGGVPDLTKKWFAKDDTKIRAYVFDYHRPIHHSNVNSQEKIIMIDDGYFNIEECPVDEDFIGLEDNEDEDDEESEDDFDKENMLPEENVFGENEDGEGMEIQTEKHRENSEGGDDEILDFGKKRREKARMRKEQEKKLKLEKIQRVQSYYRGSYFGKSIAGVMYHIAQQMNRESLDYLWFWIIGITDQLIHNRISFNQYESFISECRNEVMRLSIHYDDMREDYGDEDEIMMDKEQPSSKYKLETINKKVGTILIERDLRLFLLRNWTLYDSMKNSNYIAAKLALWKEKGRKELNRLLTKVGIPLDEAQQQYRYMNNNLKRTLKDKILDVVEQSEYGFSDILIHSFLRQVDTKTQISASDLTHAVAAILGSPKDLESAEELLEALINKSKNTNKPEEEKVNEIDPNVAFFMKDGLEYNRVKNFWYAYEALGGEVGKLEKGIDLARGMQEKIMAEAISLIEKRNIYACSEFRYCVIKNENFSEKFFNHPLTLQKLTIVMLTFSKEQSKKDIQKPFLVCMHITKTKSYLIVGVSPFGDNFVNNTEDRNEFGSKFMAAADKSNARVKYNSFDSSIIEIHEDDFETFWDELTEQN